MAEEISHMEGEMGISNPTEEVETSNPTTEEEANLTEETTIAEAEEILNLTLILMAKNHKDLKDLKDNRDKEDPEEVSKTEVVKEETLAPKLLQEEATIVTPEDLKDSETDLLGNN